MVLPPQAQAHAEAQLRQARSELERRLRAGEACHAEDFLVAFSELAADSECVVELIYTEFVLRGELGQASAPEDWYARFPQWRDRLARLFQIHAQLLADVPTGIDSKAATPLHSAAAPTNADQAKAGFADYEVEAEIGRGGMGVVYPARQRSLGRVVALKMILDGAHAAASERARFHAEAEAVARMQHPNIVAIHEIGAQEGRPYFCLEYIDGGSLDREMAGRPQSPRAAAQRVEILARAVHYAHQHGIVHRDLKPANVLLTSDGTLKISDFGLAKRLDSADSQTQTGAVMGTPSYMAPEQAEGRIRAIGPTTDVYALGAILYEMFTGRPPFRAESSLETLEQVRTQEPVSPCRLQPKLPRDLDTICLKCLQKEPNKRYATAEELADDLHRFLQGFPIHARPIAAAERAWKWARRRPALATLIVVSAVALSLLVGGWWSSIALHASAERERLQRQNADESFRQAMKAVDRMLREVAEVDLADVPQFEPKRKKLLLEARTFYQDFLAKRGDDPAVRQEAGRALSRLGDVEEMLGEHTDAERSYRSALILLEPLTTESSEAEHQRELARSQNNLGMLLKKLNRFAEAQDVLHQALDRRQQLVHAFPDSLECRQDLAASHYHLGAVLARLPGKRGESEQAYRQALSLQQLPAASFRDQPEFQRAAAQTLNNLGILLNTKEPREAEKAFEQAIEIQQELVKRHPATPAHRRDLARSYNNLAALRQRDRPKQAETTYHESLKLLVHLAGDFPRVPAYAQELAGVHNNLGLLLEDLGRLPEALRQYQEALAVRARLADDFPDVPDYRHKLAAVYLSVASILDKSRQPAQAEVSCRCARAILEKLVANHPGRAAYQSELGMTLNLLADLLFKRSRTMESCLGTEVVSAGATGNSLTALGAIVADHGFLVHARDCLVQAAACQRSALEGDRANQDYRKLLHEHFFALAQVQLRLGDHEGVARTAVELPRLYTDRHADYVCAAEFLARCIPLAAGDLRLTAAKQQERVDDYSVRAIELLFQAIAHGFQGIQELRSVPAYAPLRERDDFKKLLDKLDKSQPRIG